MRDRDLAPVAAVAALVCCGGFALAGALVGGVALASVGATARADTRIPLTDSSTIGIVKL
jgi:hypothetical protein